MNWIQWIGLWMILFPMVLGVVIKMCEQWKKDRSIVVTGFVILVFFSGCSWQGQRDQTLTIPFKSANSLEVWASYKEMRDRLNELGIEIDPDGQIVIHNAEWWSMRLCWMSNGVEAFNKTKYWKTGFKAVSTQSDPNSISATGEAVGKLAGEAGKAALR